MSKTTRATQTLTKADASKRIDELQAKTGRGAGQGKDPAH